MDKLFQQGCSVPRVYQELWCSKCHVYIFICLNKSLQGFARFRCPNCSAETKKKIKNGRLLHTDVATLLKETIVPMKAACSSEKKLELSESAYSYGPVIAHNADSFVESDKWAFLFGDSAYFGVAV